MARPGHGRSHQAEKEEEEDPVDAMIARTGCLAQHQQLQDCMAEQKDWRHCQAQLRAFGQCMAQRKSPTELQRPAGSLHGNPAPTGD